MPKTAFPVKTVRPSLLAFRRDFWTFQGGYPIIFAHLGSRYRPRLSGQIECRPATDGMATPSNVGRMRSQPASRGIEAET